MNTDLARLLLPCVGSVILTLACGLSRFVKNGKYMGTLMPGESISVTFWFSPVRKHRYQSLMTVVKAFGENRHITKFLRVHNIAIFHVTNRITRGKFTSLLISCSKFHFFLLFVQKYAQSYILPVFSWNGISSMKRLTFIKMTMYFGSIISFQCFS